MKFKNRKQAGQLLAQKLYHLKAESPVVLAIPRGGLPVAASIAQELDFPLSLLLVKKIGVPWQPELAAGALCEGYKPIFNNNVLAATGLRPEDLAQTVTEKQDELKLLKKKFGLKNNDLELNGRNVIIVDDGIATGGSILMALFALKKMKVQRIVLAVPVSPKATLNFLKTKVDEAIALHAPEDLLSVSFWYENFDAISEAEAVSIFKRVRRSHDTSTIPLPAPESTSDTFAQKPQK